MNDFCGASRVPNTKTCMTANTWKQAEAVCSAHGAYLCSEQAHYADVTKHTGCNYDHQRIYTSTKCATTEGGPLDGYKVRRGKYPFYSGEADCVKPDQDYGSTYKVRCCTLSDRALTPGASFLRTDESQSGALTNETGATMDYSDNQAGYYDDGSDTTSPIASGPDDASIKAAGPASGGGVEDGSSDNGKSLSGGAIAAIVIVVLLAVIVAAVVGALVGRRMLQRQQTAETKAVPELAVDGAEAYVGDSMKTARLSVPSIRTHSYSSAIDEPVASESKATGLTEDNGFVLDKDGSLRLHSVRRENPAYRTSVYSPGTIVGNAQIDTNTSL